MSKKRIPIPPEECGPGSRIAEIDGELCIIGVSGAIYKDVLFDREEVMKLWPPKGKPDGDS
jgi:hypothetical protein